MSNGDNWEGGTAPSAGEDLDFTIAVPNAPINADTGLTYGMVYLGTGDLPAFTGSLTANGVHEQAQLVRIQTYDINTDSFTFVIDKNLVWKGNSSANWGDTGAWLYDNAAADWENDVNAVFNAAGATATLAADASAASLAFNADATIAAGGGTLTVPLVSVASSVSATITAPTSGSLTKTGAGTLTLGSSRTDATTLSEGTLALSGSGTSLNCSNFTLGTDPAKPVTLVVTNGAGLVVNQNVVLGDDAGSKGTLDIYDGTVRVAGAIRFAYSDASATGVLNLHAGGTLYAANLYRSTAGSGTFNFDGGTLVKTSSGSLFTNSLDVAVSISSNGGTIDNGGQSIVIPVMMTGPGGMTFTGSGTTTLSANQSYTGATTVSGGTLALAGGVTMGRTLAVADGATLSLDGTAQATVSNVTFAAGSTLDVASYVPGVVPLAVATGASLPESGTVALTLGGGAFARGAYEIYTKSGVTAADGDKFAPSTGDETCSWSVVDDTLVLTVGTVGDNFWTGFGGDGKMSKAANWLSGQVPAAGSNLDFSGASSAITVNADTDATYGTVTMGDGMVTFTGSLTASAFVDSTGATNLMNVAVGANATVTIDGDLETTTRYVVQSIAAGGQFIVTGDLTAAGILEVLVNNNDGSFIVRGILKMAGSSNENQYLARGKDTSAIVMFGGLESSMVENGKRTVISAPTVVVGTNGLDITAGSTAPQFRSTPTLYAQDREYAINGTGGQRQYLFHTDTGTLTLDTTQYGTEYVAATVTVNAAIANYSSNFRGGVNATGCGRVVFNSVSTFTLGTVVSDTATLAVNPGMRPGSGTVTVHDGATLEVAQSGTVNLVGGLTLDDGANLGFNFTDKNTKPVLNVTGKTVTLGENGTVSVKVSAADGIRPKGGSYVLTSGGKFAGANVSLASGAPNWVKGVSVADGEIVLEAKSVGFQLIVK